MLLDILIFSIPRQEQTYGPSLPVRWEAASGPAGLCHDRAHVLSKGPAGFIWHMSCEWPHCFWQGHSCRLLYPPGNLPVDMGGPGHSMSQTGAFFRTASSEQIGSSDSRRCSWLGLSPSHSPVSCFRWSKISLYRRPLRFWKAHTPILLRTRCFC